VWLLALVAIVGVAQGLVWVLQHRTFPCAARVVNVERPGLHVEAGTLDASQPATAGRFIGEGVSLIAEPGSVAEIAFCDGALLRVESAGQWVLQESRWSRNGQVSRVIVRQEWGQSSLASPAGTQARGAHTILAVPGGRIELCGVATVLTTEEGGTRITVWQGRGVVVDGAGRWELQAGQEHRIGVG